MGTMPSSSPAEAPPQDLHIARRVATALWIASAAMMALLAAWSTGPYWPA